MEQTLEEKLYDLQLFKAKRLVFCNLSGNSLGEGYFHIDYIETLGGEQFRFCEVLMGTEGSGIYFSSREDVIVYAQERVAGIMTKYRPYKSTIVDADWHKQGWLADAE